MSHKFLIADDSPTIQKVIKITLANEDYELIECIDYDSLYDQIDSYKPDVVLLDFSLNESISGYEIAKEIKAKGVAKIFMLYGTFDTADEAQIAASGIDRTIVKPFEGTKFINTCRELVDSIGQVEEVEEVFEQEDSDIDFDKTAEFPNVIENEFSDVEGEEWVVNQPEVIDNEEDSVVDNLAEPKNQLHSDIADWGFDVEVPNIIGSEGETDTAVLDLPPVIEQLEATDVPDSHQVSEAKTQAEVEESEVIVEPEVEEVEQTLEVQSNFEDEVLPESDDLEYPDIDMIKSSVEAEITAAPKSQLVSIAELSEENTSEVDFDEVGEGTKTEEEVRNLEAQIADEMEEDLWSADEVIESDIESVQEVMAEAESESPTVDEESVSAAQPEEEITTSDATGDIDLEQFNLDNLKEKLGPIIDEMIEQKMKDVIENVAWEVIPDLAENLIKKQLEDIASEILSKPDN